MAAPTIPTLAPQPLLTLDPAAAATRGFFAARKRPIVAGYKMRADYAASAKLVGVNHPGAIAGGFPVGSISTNVGGSTVTYASPLNKYFATIGKGNTTAQLTNGFENYTIGTSGDFVTANGATATIPQDTDLNDATNYANAILIAFPTGTKDRAKSILFTRIARLGSLTASGQWKVNNATSIDVCWDYNATPASSNGVPSGWTLALILPAAADVVTLINSSGAGTSAITSTDFMFAGITGKTAAVTVTRLLQ